MSKATTTSLGAIFALATAIGTALAQTPGTTTQAPPPDVNLSLPQRSTISPAEMISQCQIYRQKIEATLRHVDTLLESARKEKDVIRINCLQGNQAEAKANLNMTDQGLLALQDGAARKAAAAARNDDELAKKADGDCLHEYTRVTILNQKAQVIDAEAEKCAGAEASYLGAATRTMERDSNMTKQDLTKSETGSTTTGATTDSTARPVLASTFK